MNIFKVPVKRPPLYNISKAAETSTYGGRKFNHH